jgi:hypothetical protein
MFVELTRLTAERDDLGSNTGAWNSEQATAAEPNAELFPSRFSMVSPQPAATVVIKRQGP